MRRADPETDMRSGNLKPEILIVDGNSIMRETARGILESKFPNLAINEAQNGPEALEEIDDHQPDLILMDIGLPGENGLELTRKIKKLYPQIIIIIFTDYDLPEYREAAAKNGADYFLSKSTIEKNKFTMLVESIAAGAD